MKRFITLICLIIAVASVQAEIKLPAIFGDNMLLQQNTEVNLWGWAERGKRVEVSPSWSSKKHTATADAKTGKWMLKISTPVGGYDKYSLSISENGKNELTIDDILIGEVWLCSGQSNMEMPMKGFKNQPVEGGNIDILKSKNDAIRFITVKRSSQLTPQENFTGTWEAARPETVKEFSATAYYFARLLQEMLDMPVGLVHSSWGGSWAEAWMSKEMLVDFPEINIPTKEEDVKEKNRTATALYNGMIHPILGYTIKGAIWYQGESNYERPDQYLSLFPKLVSEWRKDWNIGDFPFYYCQIAPYNYESIAPKENHGGKFNSAFLREAQYKAVDLIPNSGMAVLMDIGEDLCIHPRQKQVGGERLAMLALGKTYGMTGFAFESPTYKGMEVDGAKAILTFNNAPMWLTSFGKELKNFEVAGEDKVFHPATAKIQRSKIEVTSSKVAKPVAVRYAFKDYVEADLFSTEGLPVSSFRTDNWEE